MKNKTLSIATLLLTGALLFAGCGQTGNTTGNTSSTTAGQETATTEQTDNTAQTASDSTASTNDIFTNMDTTDIDGNKMDSSIFAKNKVTLVNVPIRRHLTRVPYFADDIINAARAFVNRFRIFFSSIRKIKLC